LHGAAALLGSDDGADEIGEPQPTCTHVAARVEISVTSLIGKRPEGVDCWRGDEPEPITEAQGEADRKLRELLKRAEFLRSHGIYAKVHTDDAWTTSERDCTQLVWQAELRALAPLSRAADNDDPFYYLAELIGGGFGDPSECERFDLPLAELAGELACAMEENGGALPELPPITPERLEELAEEWRDAGYDREVFEATGARRMARAPESIEALVPGLLYRGKVGLLLGAAQSGKSSLAHELAFKLSAKVAPDAEPLTWCGQPIQTGGRPCVVRFLSGEDSDDIVAERERALQKIGVGGCRLAVIRGGREKMRACLDSLRGKKRGDPGVPDLIIIDPARTFLEGNEDQSENVSAFLGELVELAEATGAAVLVLHHLGKNARPRSLGEVMEACRGSSVWIDRPRMVIGMYRSGGVTRLGVCKTNIPGVKVGETIALMRDEATGQHLPKVEATSAKAASPSRRAEAAPALGDAGERVMAALRRLAGEGKRVTRAGKRDGLYEQAPPELAGMARDLVRETIGALMETGRIVMEDGGLYPADDAETLPEAAE
jgi:hypothetical protein